MKSTCEQGASLPMLSRASLIMHLLSAGVCLTTGRKQESAVSQVSSVSNQILHYTQSSIQQVVFSEVCCLLGRDEWKSCNYNQPDEWQQPLGAEVQRSY